MCNAKMVDCDCAMKHDHSTALAHSTRKSQIEAANFAASQEFLVPPPSFLRQLRMWTEKVLRAKTIWLASGHTSHPKQERHHKMAALCQCLTMV